MEALRQLCINTNFLRSIQIFNKTTLNALFGRAIREHIVLNCLIRMKSLIKGLGTLFSRKDGTIITTFKLIVGNMFNNHGSLLFFNEFNHL